MWPTLARQGAQSSLSYGTIVSFAYYYETPTVRCAPKFTIVAPLHSFTCGWFRSNWFFFVFVSSFAPHQAASCRMAKPTQEPSSPRRPRPLAELPPSHKHDGGGDGNNNNPPKSTPAAAATANENNHAPDPDPFPAAANPLQLTPLEERAVDNWWRRNESFWTSIPWYHFPAPPALASLWGWSMADDRGRVFDALYAYTNLARRRLTDQERDSLVETLTRTNLVLSYQRPLGWAVTSFFIWQSWRKSGMQQSARATAREAAAATAGGGLGGAGGHITHFSNPHYTVGLGSQITSKLKHFSMRLGRATVTGVVATMLCFSLGKNMEVAARREAAELVSSDERLRRLMEDVAEVLPDEDKDWEEIQILSNSRSKPNKS